MNSLASSPPAAGSLAGGSGPPGPATAGSPAGRGDRAGRPAITPSCNSACAAASPVSAASELIAAPAPGAQEIRGTAENRGRGLPDPQRRAVDAVAVQPWLNEDAVQPDQLVDQAHGRPSGSAQPGRAVGRGQEGTAQRLDGLVRLRSRVIAIPRRLSVHPARGTRPPHAAGRPAPGRRRPRRHAAGRALARATGTPPRPARRLRPAPSRPAGRARPTPERPATPAR